MKTYAGASYADELKAKLISYYQHMAEVKRGELKYLSLKRDCDKAEAHALFYEEQVRFLTDLKLFDPAYPPHPGVSMGAMFL